MDLLHFGHCPYFGVDSIVVKSLYISVCRDFLLSDIEKDRYILYHQDIELIIEYRYLCISGHWTDHRTHWWIRWTNSCVSYSGQVILVSL